MRSIERQIVRCPQPHCGGQLLIQDDHLTWGHWERLLACSLCGREWKVATRADSATKAAVGGATG